MRYIVTLFWAIILGQIVGFLGANLTGNTYSFVQTTIVSVIIAFIAMLLTNVTESCAKNK